MLHKLTYDDIETQILGADSPVLLACLYQDSGSRFQKKAVEEAAALTGKTITMYIAEGEVLNTVGHIFGVPGTPTYIMFDRGREVARLLGQTDAHSLARFIRNTVFELGLSPVAQSVKSHQSRRNV